MTDLNRSIEELENDFWDEPAFPSYVVTTCHRARKKPVSALSHEEIRCLIGQKIGLPYLLPVAADILENEPLTECAYFPGDLLLALLRLDLNDWAQNRNALQRFRGIIRESRTQIEQSEEIPDRLIGKYI